MFWWAVFLIFIGNVFLLIEVCFFPGKIMNAMLGVGFLGWGMYLFLEHYPPWKGQVALLSTLVLVSVVLIIGLRFKNVIQALREEDASEAAERGKIDKPDGTS